MEEMEKKKFYVIKIEEVLRRHIIVQAESIDDACMNAQQAYENADIILYADDFADMNIECCGIADKKELEIYEKYVCNTD